MAAERKRGKDWVCREGVRLAVSDTGFWGLKFRGTCDEFHSLSGSQKETKRQSGMVRKASPMRSKSSAVAMAAHKTVLRLAIAAAVAAK